MSKNESGVRTGIRILFKQKGVIKIILQNRRINVNYRSYFNSHFIIYENNEIDLFIRKIKKFRKLYEK